jgi:hypothetical protein
MVHCWFLTVKVSLQVIRGNVLSALDLARNGNAQMHPTVIAIIYSEGATKWDCEISFEKSIFANEANPGAGSKTREETVCPCYVPQNLLQIFGSNPRLCP